MLRITENIAVRKSAISAVYLRNNPTNEWVIVFYGKGFEPMVTDSFRTKKDVIKWLEENLPEFGRVLYGQ